MMSFSAHNASIMHGALSRLRAWPLLARVPLVCACARPGPLHRESVQRASEPRLHQGSASQPLQVPRQPLWHQDAVCGGGIAAAATITVLLAGSAAALALELKAEPVNALSLPTWMVHVSSGEI